MTKKVMVIDDEEDVKILFELRFRREIRDGRLEFVFAFNGEKALEMLGGGADVVLILSDINMPGMSGIQLLRHIREGHPSLPVVMISGDDSATLREEVMGLGATDYITKPIDFDALGKRLGLA